MKQFNALKLLNALLRAERMLPHHQGTCSSFLISALARYVYTECKHLRLTLGGGCSLVPHPKNAGVGVTCLELRASL